MGESTVDLVYFVWRLRATGREWRSKPMSQAMGDAWLRTARETGSPAIEHRLEPLGRLGRGSEALGAKPLGWGVRRQGG